MTSLFCRHNRMTARCPICSKEMEAELRAKAPPRPPGIRRAPAAAPRRAAAAAARPGRLVTRRIARAEDDGYRNPLVPGLRATADAERLAAALALAGGAARAAGPLRRGRDRARPRAGDLARLPARARRPRRARAPGRPSRPPRRASRTGELPEPLAEHARAIAAYRQWAERAGSQVAGFTGEPDWSPQRRFARVFERLALPGLGRAPRFELLATLGAAGLYELEPDTLQLSVEDDATTQAAKRALQSGDKMLLERRARDLAVACELPLVALDRGFALWDDPGAEVEWAEGAHRGDALRPRAAVTRRRRDRRSASLAAAAARLPRARRARASACRPGPPMTRGPGSTGAARSRSGTSTRAPARPGSRCRCCSRRRSRSPATPPPRSCGS